MFSFYIYTFMLIVLCYIIHFPGILECDFLWYSINWGNYVMLNMNSAYNWGILLVEVVGKYWLQFFLMLKANGTFRKQSKKIHSFIITFSAFLFIFLIRFHDLWYNFLFYSIIFVSASNLQYDSHCLIELVACHFLVHNQH